MQWKPQDDDRLRHLAREGQSAATIGLAIGRSRNSVIGRSHRLSVQLRGKATGGKRVEQIPSQPRAKRQNRVPPAPRHRAVIALPPPIAATPEPIPTISGGSPTAGRPMMLLGKDQCQFAVNDASFGELHLFCGVPADGVWCEHHRGIVYQRPALKADLRALLAEGEKRDA